MYEGKTLDEIQVASEAGDERDSIGEYDRKTMHPDVGLGRSAGQ